MHSIAGSPNEQARLFNQRMDTLIAPWEDFDAHQIVSPEPLAIFRFLTDKRFLENAAEKGSAHFYATAEMTEHAARYAEGATKLGIPDVHIVSLPGLSSDRSGSVIAARNYAVQNMGPDSTLNTTPGPRPIVDALRVVALDSGASLVSLSTYNDTLYHEHGKRHTGPEEEFQSDWGKLGVDGLMSLFGKKLQPKLSGAYKLGDIRQRGSRPYSKDERPIAQRVETALFEDPAVRLAATNVTYDTPAAAARNEIDAVAIKDGTLIRVEIKATGHKGLARSIYNAIQQLRNPNRLQTHFATEYIVLPDSPDALLEPLKEPYRQIAQSALDIAALHNIKVQGIEGFTQNFTRN